MNRTTLIILGVFAALVVVLWHQTSLDGTENVDNPDGDGDGLDIYANTVGALMSLASTMNISSAQIDRIRAHEGLSLKAYPDFKGYSIGYGHLGATKDQTCTLEQAEAWLASDAGAAAGAVRKYVRVALNQNQFDALCDFVFALGTGAFAGSTLLRELNAGNYDDVPNQMNRWVNAGGKFNQSVQNRRNEEIAVWNTPAADDQASFGVTGDYGENPGGGDDQYSASYDPEDDPDNYDDSEEEDGE